MEQTNGGQTTRDQDDDSTAFIRLREDNETPAESVIELVATVTGKSTEHMSPLFDAIDPDALNTILDREHRQSDESSQTQVSFRFNGCDVTIYADGRTIVSPTPSAGE
jgi:hypothetical protein